MPSNPKLFIPNKPYLITSRTESGLYFIPTEFMNDILMGILATAAQRYEVDVCHYYWTTNHFHLILIPRMTNAIPKFMKYIKQESSHAINRLLGRRRRTVWCARYDSPIVLTASSIAKYIAYTYTNPEKDRIIDSIDNFTGVSSWKRYKHKKHSISAKRIPRNAITPLDNPTNITREERKTLASKYKNLGSETYSFRLKPYACVTCFEETSHLSNSEIDEMIEAEMGKIREEIPADKTPIHDRKSLLMVQIKLDYQPKKFGKKMIAICDDVKLRKDFISWFKGIREQAREVYEKWKKFHLDIPWPAYLIPPAKPKNLSPVVFYN